MTILSIRQTPKLTTPPQVVEMESPRKIMGGSNDLEAGIPHMPREARPVGAVLTWPGFATAADNPPAPPVTTPSPATAQPAPATAPGTTDQGNTKDQANSQDQGNKQAQANGGGSFPDPDCTGDIPKVPPRGNQVLRVALSDLPSSSRGTIWQPRGDEVNFTMTSVKGGTLDPMKVAVCFRWRGGTRTSDWMPSPMPLRTIKIDSSGSITYAARVPNLPDAATNWFSRVLGQAGQDEYAGCGSCRLRNSALWQRPTRTGKTSIPSCRLA
ncbi:MAG: hypothetical protein JOZ11_11890 [Alphaproteobacteria bacterium]|nr:hypothetical protein [Alphaproteobacteria bacterium]